MGRNRTLGSPYAVVEVTASFQTLAEVDVYAVDAPSGGIIATLDPNAVDGDQVVIQDIANVAGTEPITVEALAGQTILDGFGDSYDIATDGGGAQFTYSAGLNGWMPQAVSPAPNSILGPNVTTTGPLPSVTPLAGTGSGATASLSSGSNDTAGQIILNIGSAGRAAGPQVLFTFATPFASPPRTIQIFPGNALAAASIYNMYVDTVTTTSFVLEAEGDLAPDETYLFWYIVLG